VEIVKKFSSKELGPEDRVDLRNPSSNGCADALSTNIRLEMDWDPTPVSSLEGNR
jgi:hypothetical protein